MTLAPECESDTDIAPAPVRSRLETMSEMAQRIQDVLGRMDGLDEPRTSEYVAGMSMLDLD